MEDRTCSICTRPLVINVKTLKCRHAFHIDCIVRWVDESETPTCPLCRGCLCYMTVHKIKMAAFNEFKLTELSFLNNSMFSDLEILNLSDNKLEDISALTTLINLESLHINGNRIRDLSCLKQLNLHSLSVDGVNLEQIEAIDSLVELHLYNVDCTLLPLTTLTNLTKLSLTNCYKKVDLAPIAYLRDLKELTLETVNVNDASPLRYLMWLETLNINATDVSNIDFLKNMSMLISLTMIQNRIVDVDALKDLNLHILDLSNNFIVNVEPISEIESLSFLTLKKNQIQDASALAQLKNIKVLDVSNNIISDFTFINELPMLMSFRCYRNELVDIERITEHPNYEQSEWMIE